MRNIFKGSTSHSEYIVLVDSTTGLPKTGIADTAVTGSYVRTRAARTAITMSALGAANSAYSSGGWFEVDATNTPGLYRVDVPDAAFATGVDQVYLTIKATGCKTETKEFRLADWNDQVAAIPNAVAGASGGVFIAGSNAATTANITGNLTGNVTGSVGSVATGGIAAASFAAGAIDAAAIATDAIGSAELAASAITEIQAGLSTLDAAGVRTAVGLASANLDTQIGTLATAAALTTVDDFLDTEVAAILAAVDTEVAAIKAKTDNLPAAPAATGDIPTASAIADQVWDEILSGHAGVGSTGAALSAAGGSGDPWSTALPGAYGAGTAGKIIGDNINTTVSSRASQTSVDTVDDFLDTEVAAIKAQTDLIPASPAAVGSAMTLATGSITAAVVATGAIDADALATDAVNEIADGVLDRNMATGTDSGSPTVRTMRQALRKLRNKWTVVGTTWTTYKEDDVTVSFSETVTTDAAADPVTGSDPA